PAGRARVRARPGGGGRGRGPPLRLPVVQVEGGRLPAQRPGRRGAEQRLVVLPPPYVLAVGLRVARPAAPPRRGAVGEEELRFLDRGHEQLGGSGQGHVQRGGASLGGTGEEEIRQGHPGDLPGGGISYYLGQFNRLRPGRQRLPSGLAAAQGGAAAGRPVLLSHSGAAHAAGSSFVAVVPVTSAR